MVNISKTDTEFELSPTLHAHEMVIERRKKGQPVTVFMILFLVYF